MSDRLDSLKALREKVRAGATTGLNVTHLPDFMRPELGEAVRDSLDAAKALHDAVLPGWIFDVTNDSAFVMVPWAEQSDDPSFLNQYTGESDNPARAWLIAILSALIDIEEGKA